MRYPSIEKIARLCIPKLKALPDEYCARFIDEVRDLKKWQLFLQKNKAAEILDRSGEMKPSNRSASVILWLVGASSIDPVADGLSCVKARFGKADPPDIDLDLNPDIRDDVKNFLIQKFGDEHVCSVGTVSTYKTKNVILDVARALGLDVREAMDVTKNLDAGIGEGDVEMKLDDASFDEICEFQPELATYFDKHEDVRRHAEVLRNQAKNYGMHAGGVIISNLNLTDRIPVFGDKEGHTISAWAESGDHQELSSIGFVKWDILGLSNLPVIDDCIRFIKDNRGIELKRKDIPINDKESIRLGTAGELHGIFQFENPYTKRIADQVGVDGIGDIAAITSLIRPGPKDVGLDVEYARRKNGKPYERNEIFDKVLGDTYSVLVYQEQVQLLGIHMAGLTPVEANRLRKGASKKKKDIMDEMKPKFIAGAIERCVDTGIMTKEQVEETWNMIENTAKYSFNRSHAFAYSAITTMELYLRHHYFHEYMASLLQNTNPSAKKFGDTIFNQYIRYAISGGVSVHKPDINQSGERFRISGRHLWFALGHVKNVSGSAKAVEKFQPYESMKDFHKRCRVGVGPGSQPRRPNSRVVESLIYAGAFDCFGTRPQIMKEYYALTGRVKKSRIPKPGADVKKYIIPKIDSVTDTWITKRRQFFVKRFETDDGLYELVDDVDIELEYEWLPDLDDESLRLKEVEMLGVSLSENLAVKYRDIGAEHGIVNLRSAKHQDDRVKISVLGRIERINERTSRDGRNYLNVRISDGLWDYGFTVWGESVHDFNSRFQEGDVAVIPLRNRGAGCDNPHFRYFDDRGKSAIIERDGEEVL